MTIQPGSSLHVFVTPPGSSTACPLTPPPTDEKHPSTVLRIVEDIRSRKAKTGARVGASRIPVPWAVYSLDAEAYRNLLQRIQRDKTLAGFAEHELRLDYFPSTQRLVLRMPSAVHKLFIASIVEEIKTQLNSFTGPSRVFAQAIKFGGSSRIKFDDAEYGAHDPNRQFQHPNAQYPGVEPEVVKDKDEENVLIAKQTIENQVFRTATGSPPPNYALEIPLQAFAPSSCYPFNVPPQGSITIPAHTLCTFLQEAEKTASMIVQKTGLVKLPATRTWKKKRRREITPEDELLESDKKRFKIEENKALELETKDNGSFAQWNC
ncbi:hypothetical protein IFR05_013817 [Cadophora sp. M221]|nr:hypothetical protein IFR05_013817 [Cadophora sp. M221]